MLRNKKTLFVKPTKTVVTEITWSVNALNRHTSRICKSGRYNSLQLLPLAASFSTIIPTHLLFITGKLSREYLWKRFFLYSTNIFTSHANLTIFFSIFYFLFSPSTFFLFTEWFCSSSDNRKNCEKCQIEMRRTLCFQAPVSSQMLGETTRCTIFIPPPL